MKEAVPDMEEISEREMNERDLTPAEIRGVLLQLARKQIDERGARPAIDALNKIMRGGRMVPSSRDQRLK